MLQRPSILFIVTDDHQSAALGIHGAALCDVMPENLRIAGLHFPAARLYPKPEAMFAAESLDAVMVLTSEKANAATAELCLRAGLPVYLEKPPALTPGEHESLGARERAIGTPLFVAFNRRHTPLMAGFTPPRGLRLIRGRMERLGRPVASFPYTALHIIDSLLFFAGSSPASLSIEYTAKPVDKWSLRGHWATGVICELEIVPAGREHREYLVFEGAEETIDIQFPNPESQFPVGRKSRIRDGQATETLNGKRSDSLNEMGYTPSFRKFAEQIEGGRGPSAVYQLSSCKDAITIMSAMMRRENTEVHLSPLVASV